MIKATFSNGKTITRNSKKQYGYAWFASNKWQSDTGFTSSKQSAEATARNRFNGTESKTQYWEVVETTA
jgi:hypothetical protein